MSRIDPVYLEHERKRFMRPDAHRFVRPDWRRYVAPDSDVAALYAGYERKYSPDQPRVPAGSREGGRWTSGSDDIGSMLAGAKRLAARGYSNDYLRCLDFCSPILERPQPPGVDYNQWDFRKCMNACLQRNH